MNDCHRSLWKMFVGAVIEAVLFLFGVAQIAGTIVDLQDGDVDASVWTASAIGIVCLVSIVPIYEWSVRA